MKNIFLVIVAIFSFAFASCSSIHTVKSFSSKEKLYQDFNNSVRDKSVEVKFINNSSLTFNNGAVIKSDTLYAINYNIDKKFRKTALPEIKILKYTGSDYKSAILFLQSNEQINASDIEIANDTIEYSITKKILKQTEIAPLDKIKEVSYKNHWLGIPGRFFIGTATGIVLGLTIGSALDDNTQGGLTRSEIIFLTGPSIGALIGIVWGYLDGYTYIYQFNT